MGFLRCFISNRCRLIRFCKTTSESEIIFVIFRNQLGVSRFNATTPLGCCCAGSTSVPLTIHKTRSACVFLY